jgi:hypothetical protein
MVERRDIREAFDPWVGLVLGPLVWWIHQRTVADGQALDCHDFSVAGRAIWSLLLIVVLGWSFVASLGVWRRWPPHEASTDNRRFIALVSAGVAALCGLAVFFGTLAALIVPECLQQ